MDEFYDMVIAVELQFATILKLRVSSLIKHILNSKIEHQTP